MTPCTIPFYFEGGEMKKFENLEKGTVNEVEEKQIVEQQTQKAQYELEKAKEQVLNVL